MVFRNVLGCFAASLFSFYNLYLFAMMNVLGVYLMHDLKITPSELGFLGSCDLWGNVLSFIPIGIMLDRFNTRRVGISLLILAIVSTFLMGFVSNLYTLSLLRFLQGVASAGSLLITMRVGVSFSKHSNKIIGFMILIALSGGLLGNSGFSYLASNIGWQNSLKLTALLGVICLIIMWLFLPDTKHLAKSTRFSLKHFINKKYLWAGCQIGLLNSPVFLLGSLFGNHVLMQQTGFTVEQTTFISSLLFLGVMLGSPFFGYFADKISNSIKIILIGYLGLFFSFILLIIDSKLSFITYCVVFFLIGCFCCTQNLIYPLLARKSELLSTATAMSALIFNSLGAFLQITFGFLLGLATGNINLALLLFPFLFVIGIVYLFQYS